MTTLKDLENTLDFWKDRKKIVENSDIFCYSNGKINEINQIISKIEKQIKDFKNNLENNK